MKVHRTKIFENGKDIVRTLKLNYLHLEDLGRNKFDFSTTQSYVIKKKYNETYISSEKKLSDQVEIIMAIEWR